MLVCARVLGLGIPGSPVPCERLRAELFLRCLELELSTTERWLADLRAAHFGL
jgi:hypothetical protein